MNANTSNTNTNSSANSDATGKTDLSVLGSNFLYMQRLQSKRANFESYLHSISTIKNDLENMYNKNLSGSNCEYLAAEIELKFDQLQPTFDQNILFGEGVVRAFKGDYCNTPEGITNMYHRVKEACKTMSNNISILNHAIDTTKIKVDRLLRDSMQKIPTDMYTVPTEQRIEKLKVKMNKKTRAKINSTRAKMEKPVEKPVETPTNEQAIDRVINAYINLGDEITSAITKCGAMVTGSYLLQSVHNEFYPDSDIDIFCPSSNIHTMLVALSNIKGSTNIRRDVITSKYQNNCIVSVTDYKIPTQVLKIQVIEVSCKEDEISQYIEDYFDISVCKIRINDKCMYPKDLSEICQKRGTVDLNVVNDCCYNRKGSSDYNRRDTESNNCRTRLVKYNKRGYDIRPSRHFKKN